MANTAQKALISSETNGWQLGFVARATEEQTKGLAAWAAERAFVAVDSGEWIAVNVEQQGFCEWKATTGSTRCIGNTYDAGLWLITDEEWNLFVAEAAMPRNPKPGQSPEERARIAALNEVNRRMNRASSDL